MVRQRANPKTNVPPLKLELHLTTNPPSNNLSNFLSIQKTTDKVSEKTLNEVYKPTIITNLGDKIPNVKAKALKVLRGNKKLGDKAFDKYVEKLKTDMDC